MAYATLDDLVGWEERELREIREWELEQERLIELHREAQEELDAQYEKWEEEWGFGFDLQEEMGY